MIKVSSNKNWCRPWELSKKQMWPASEKDCTCLSCTLIIYLRENNTCKCICSWFWKNRSSRKFFKTVNKHIVSTRTTVKHKLKSLSEQCSYQVRSEFFLNFYKCCLFLQIAGNSCKTPWFSASSCSSTFSSSSSSSLSSLFTSTFSLHKEKL